MNRKDRDAWDVIDAVLKQIARFAPTSPADLKTIAQNLPAATRASEALSMAIGNIRCGDWEGAHLRLADAAQAVRLAGRRQCPRCARSGGELTENGCPACGPRTEIRWVPDRPFRVIAPYLPEVRRG